MPPYARCCMKAARLFSVAVMLGALAVARGNSLNLPPALPVGWQAKLAAMLPTPGQNVTLLQWQPSLSTVELQMRVARAGGSPEALQQVIVSASKGVVAPYDERLGISEQQYKTYLVFQPVLVSTGKTFKLPVLRDSAHVLFGDSALLGGVLKGVGIDLKTGELRAPEGFTAKPQGVVPSTTPGPGLDVKSGFQWKVIGSNATVGNGVRGTMTLLQLADGQYILRYTRVSMMQRVINEGDIILRYVK